MYALTLRAAVDRLSLPGRPTTRIYRNATTEAAPVKRRSLQTTSLCRILAVFLSFFKDNRLLHRAAVDLCMICRLVTSHVSSHGEHDSARSFQLVSIAILAVSLVHRAHEHDVQQEVYLTRLFVFHPGIIFFLSRLLIWSQNSGVSTGRSIDCNVCLWAPVNLV